jgi:NDP-sugar pyrophosphorylase family protein
VDRAFVLRSQSAHLLDPLHLSHALVLTAGLGTRLRPLTTVRAKPAIPVAGVPLVERIIGWLVRQGVVDLVLNLHYKPETITAVIGDGRHLGARVRYSWEQPEVLGSAGGPRLAAQLLPTGPCLVVNGDTLTDLDVGALGATHAQSGALVTMALVPNDEPQRYGGVRLAAGGQVVGFAKRGPDAVGTYHFIGVQVASMDAFESVRAGEARNTVGDVYDRLIAERPGSVCGYVCAAGFWDIGRVEDYWRTSVALAAPEAVSHAPARVTLLGRGRHVDIDPTATIHQSIVWDRVTVGAGAILDGCIVTDDVTVPSETEHRNAILLCGPERTLTAVPRPTD